MRCACPWTDLMGTPYVIDTYDYTDKTGAEILY